MQWGIHYALSYGKVRKCGTNCGGLGGFALFKVHIVCSRDFGSGVSNFSTFPLCLLDVWREGVKCLVCGVHFLANLCRTYNYLFYCKLNIFIAHSTIFIVKLSSSSSSSFTYFLIIYSSFIIFEDW